MRSKSRKSLKIYVLFMFNICVTNKKKVKRNNKKLIAIIKFNKKAQKLYILHLCLLYA